MQVLTIDEVKKIEFSMLKTITDYLDDNNLRYILDFGTLLGAIRHKGFIPWDDDIDISMPRPDYDRFIELVKEKPLPNKYILSCDRKTNCIIPYMKVEDRSTIIESVNRIKKYPMSVFIDIFPVDGCVDDEQKIAIQNKRILRYDYMRGLTCYKSNTNTGVAKRMLRKLFALVSNPYRYVDKMTKIQKQYSYDECPCGRIIVGGFIKRKIETMDKAFFTESIDVEFEGHIFKAPKNWDKRLTDLYGDYMKLPPENERVCHFVKAYKLEEKDK